MSQFLFAFSFLAVFEWHLWAGARGGGAAAPPGGEKHDRPVQPAAAADQRRTGHRPAEGRKLQGKIFISQFIHV